jgi:hypothetical protein
LHHSPPGAAPSSGAGRRGGVAVTLAEPRERRPLRNFERATGQKIEVARVPTVADEFDVMDVALGR